MGTSPLEFHLDMVTDALRKDTKILLLGEYLNNGRGGQGERSHVVKLYDVIFCRHGCNIQINRSPKGAGKTKDVRVTGKEKNPTAQWC